MAERVERRLTTILAPDVAEYTRLMRADEDSTLAGLTECRVIVDALITEYRGRIANTAGDSVLAEFPSVVDGLSCALAIQAAIAKYNEPVSADRQMRFRIGLHPGDVMIKNGDLFGDAVNIAARLQALAERAAFTSRRRCASTSELAVPRDLLTQALSGSRTSPNRCMHSGWALPRKRRRKARQAYGSGPTPLRCLCRTSRRWRYCHSPI